MAFGILIAFFTQRVILPFLTELKNKIIALFLSWKFNLVVSVVVLSSIRFAFYLSKIKKERLERERVENAKYWKQKELEEEKKKKYYKYLEPKLKVLPPFVNEIQEEAEENIEEDLDADYLGEPREIKSINVDLRKLFYKREELNRHEIEYLIKQGYQEVCYKSICTQDKENYLIKPRFNESLGHMIVIYDIAEYLDMKLVDYELFMTRMPDIVMKFKRKKIAFEVETGTVMSNMRKFREKLSLLKKNYGNDWYFIVTNRNKIKRYKKYGKVIDPRYIKGQIDKIVKNARK